MLEPDDLEAVNLIAALAAPVLADLAGQSGMSAAAAFHLCGSEIAALATRAGYSKRALAAWCSVYVQELVASSLTDEELYAIVSGLSQGLSLDIAINSATRKIVVTIPPVASRRVN